VFLLCPNCSEQSQNSHLGLSVGVTVALTNSLCHIGKATNRRWSADPWCLTKSSFFGLDATFQPAKIFYTLAPTHILHLKKAATYAVCGCGM